MNDFDEKKNCFLKSYDLQTKFDDIEINYNYIQSLFNRMQSVKIKKTFNMIKISTSPSLYIYSFLIIFK